MWNIKYHSLTLKHYVTYCLVGGEFVEWKIILDNGQTTRVSGGCYFVHGLKNKCNKYNHPPPKPRKNISEAF